MRRDSSSTSEYIFLIVLFLYISFGMLLLVSSAENHYKMIMKQSAHITLAVCILIGVRRLPASYLERGSVAFYCSVLTLLALVLLFGHTGKGAQRWLSLGWLRFEPSELMKLALPLTLASRIHHRDIPLSGATLAECALIILLPFAMIAKQPDLGTACIIAFIGIIVLVLAGVPLRIWLRLTLTALLCAPVGWTYLHDYQKQRIITLLQPQQDTTGKGYHIHQAKIAIGGGGLYGQGWRRGTQAHLRFLPEHNTDFIFALCAEEFGFLGCVLLLFGMLTLTSLGCYLAILAEDIFSRLAIAGIISAYALCSCINIAMVCGLLPVVGIPLPFISYGGTTMVVSMLGFACLLSCSRSSRLFRK